MNKTPIAAWQNGILQLQLIKGEPTNRIDRVFAAVQEGGHDWSPQGFLTGTYYNPKDTTLTLIIDLSEVTEEERLSLARGLVDHFVNELQWATISYELRDALAAEDDPYA